MKEIKLGSMICKKRKEKKITQDDLALFLGVTKASVSKWETGQSYPDITLLPLLAAYFNISLDELIGYQPNMSTEEIKKLYQRLSKDFAIKDFKEVMAVCENLTKKYFSCFPLLLNIVVLYMNHYMLATAPEEQEAILQKCLTLLQHIIEESNDVWLAKEATMGKSQINLMLNQPDKVLTLLGENVRPLSTDAEMQATAFHMLGQADKAKETIQVAMYQHLLLLLGDSIQCITLYANDEAKAEDILIKSLSLIELFRLESLHANVSLQLYFVAANHYCTNANYDKALKMLHKFAFVAKNYLFPLHLHGDAYFDKIDIWLKELNLGNGAPRNEALVKTSLAQCIISNPAFQPLSEFPEYQDIIAQLESIIGGN